MVARPVTLLLSICVVGGAHHAQAYQVARPIPNYQAPTPQVPGSAQKNPIIKTKVEPAYTEAARAAGIQGEVWIEAVVDATGKVARAKVSKSLDKVFGLDEQAMFAAGQWTFEPGTTNGVPADKTVMLILEFKPNAPVGLTFVPNSARPPTAPEFGAGAHRPGPGVTNPTLLRKQEVPARGAGIQGEVWIEAVVRANGLVGEMRVIKSLDSTPGGLDAAALAAAARWLFRPGSVNGTNVPVLVTLVLEVR